MPDQHTNTQPPKLVIADDEVAITEIIQEIAEDMGFAVTCVHKGLDVVNTIDRVKPAVLALDLRMPGADGVEIIRELGLRKCKSGIILMSGMDQRTLSSVQSLGREYKLEIGSTLTKPMSVDAITEALHPYLANRNILTQKPEARHPRKFEFGLSIVYEPELLLKPIQNMNSNRLKVIPGWRMDNNELYTGQRLREWQTKSNIGNGLTRQILANVLETLRVWGIQGFSPRIALKLNPEMLLQLDMPDILADIADRYCVPRELLCIEIDEASITQRQNSVKDVLSRLSIKGFKLSISCRDQGDEILQMIDNIPVDSIEINFANLANDSRLLRDMETEFLYSTLTSVSNRKGITTCAKNVSTAELLAFVQKCNFNSVRGSHVFAPVPPEDILPLFKEGKFIAQDPVH